MACLLAHKSTHLAHLRDTVVAAFDWLHAGFLIASASGRLLFANDAGAEILEGQDGLVLDEDGTIKIRSIEGAPKESSVGKFAAILAAARRHNGLIVSIPRRSDRLPLTLTLRPTRPESAREAEAGAVLVLIHDPERPANADQIGLRELYGLTLTEARLANLIMQGKTIEDCTRILGIRRTTVKMHLRNLYGKTGVNRQSELVALLFKSFGSVRCSTQASERRGKPFLVAEQGIAC